jgi:hypothetical protein
MDTRYRKLRLDLGELQTEVSTAFVEVVTTWGQMQLSLSLVDNLTRCTG